MMDERRYHEKQLYKPQIRSEGCECAPYPYSGINEDLCCQEWQCKRLGAVRIVRVVNSRY